MKVAFSFLNDAEYRAEIRCEFFVKLKKLTTEILLMLLEVYDLIPRIKFLNGATSSKIGERTLMTNSVPRFHQNL